MAGNKGRGRVRVEIVAVGTELLLGQIPDTNRSGFGERLAANGHLLTLFTSTWAITMKRIVLAFRTAPRA